MRILFQFTPLREGRPDAVITSARVHAISIHAPPRGATNFSRENIANLLFQFTPLREGRPASASSACARTHNFNSRPSARGDGDEAEPSPEVIISIHAPPRGATQSRSPRHPLRPISIHAPPRGATVAGTQEDAEEIFQFTPLREGRHKLGYVGFEICEISIHAPPRGATRRAGHWHH